MDERTRRLRELYDTMAEYTEWFGAVHGEDCPADDTCDCIGGDLNRRVNEAMQNAKAVIEHAREQGTTMKEHLLEALKAVDYVGTAGELVLRLEGVFFRVDVRGPEGVERIGAAHRWQERKAALLAELAVLDTESEQKDDDRGEWDPREP